MADRLVGSGNQCLVDAEVPAKVRVAVTGTPAGQVSRTNTVTDDGTPIALFCAPVHQTGPVGADELQAATARLDTGLSEHLRDTTDPGPGNLQVRALAAVASAVPAVWRDAVPVAVSMVSGTSSLSSDDNRLRLGTYHLSGPWWRLQWVAGHEFGHHIAFDFGSQAVYGGAPAGWPASGSNPVERWADCTSRAFTGVNEGSHGMSPCDGPSLAWATSWLAAGPAAHARTGR